MSVGRIAAAIGLKRSSEKKHLISSRIRTQMVKRKDGVSSSDWNL